MDRPHLGSKATNQSQFLPTCVSDFVSFCFFLYIYIYIYFLLLLLLNSILFLILSSPSDTVALLISKMV